MKIMKWRIYIDLFAFVIGVFFIILLSYICFSGIIRFYRDYGVLWGSILGLAGVILLIPFIGILLLLLSFLKQQFKMLNIFVSIDESGGVVITSPRSKFEIPRSNLKHILKGNLGTMIVWYLPYDPDKIKTFLVRKQYFRPREYKEFVDQLSKYDCFCENLEENKKISKEYGLRHIFRKNMLELEL